MRRHLVLAFTIFALTIVAATLVPLSLLSDRTHLSSFVEQELLSVQRAADAVGRGSRVPLNERFEDASSAGWLLTVNGAPDGRPTIRDAFPALASGAPEVEAARRGDTTHRLVATPLGPRLVIATPVLTGRTLTGILWVSSSLAPVRRLDSQTHVILGAIGAAAMALAALIGIALARRLSRRVEGLAAGAEAFAVGRLQERIEVRGTDEIAELAVQLNEMASQIDQSIARERDFVAAASHQLRTPLAAIQIRIDELLAEDEGGHPDTVGYLKEMAAEVERLTMLTTRLLDLSSAESQRVVRPLAPGYAIREALDRVEPLAHHHTIELVRDLADEDATILAPRGTFEEAVFNLLDNAVKFSRPGSAVEVRGARDNGTYVVEILDRGPGIPDDKRERVLEPFYRATRTKPGYGLGLAITQRLCESAGASVELDARDGGGTVGRIRWPLGGHDA